MDTNWLTSFPPGRQSKMKNAPFFVENAPSRLVQEGGGKDNSEFLFPGFPDSEHLFDRKISSWSQMYRFVNGMRYLVPFAYWR